MLVEKGDWGLDVMERPSLVCLTFRGLSVHFFVWERAVWTWGLKEDWYDGPLYMLGAGPIGMVCWLGGWWEVR